MIDLFMNDYIDYFSAAGAGFFQTGGRYDRANIDGIQNLYILMVYI